MATFFKKLFSAPNYLSLPAAGISIDNQSIKYIEFKKQKGRILVETSGEIKLSPNTVRDGEILNAELFAKALAAVKSKIKSDFVRIAVPEEKTYIFDIQIPRMKVSDIRAALAFKLEENVPFTADEVFFEYEMVKDPAGKKNTGDMLISVSVIPKKIVNDIADTCTRAGLEPISFEIESRMTARSLIASEDPRTCMIINIKDNSTVLSLVSQNTTRFSSTIAIGNTELMQSLEKESTGKFSGKYPSALLLSDELEEAQALLANVFSVMKDGVEKFNEYVISKSQDTSIPFPSSIDTIILSGTGALLPGLIRHLGQHIDAPIMCGNVWVNVCDLEECLPPLKYQDALGFATAIGLAMPALI